MVTDIVALVCFVGFVIGALVFARPRPEGLAAARRKFRISLFLVYALGASFGAGFTQRDLWPFVVWPLVAARLPAVVTEPRMVAVDARGEEHGIDYRAWWPLSFDELIGWMNQDFTSLAPEARDRVARYLLTQAEDARRRARTGSGVGHFGRVLGPVAAPLFLLHPALWSKPAFVPDEPFVGLRYYQETWNLEARAQGSGHVSRRLVYRYPPAP